MCPWWAPVTSSPARQRSRRSSISHRPRRPTGAPRRPPTPPWFPLMTTTTIPLASPRPKPPPPTTTMAIRTRRTVPRPPPESPMSAVGGWRTQPRTTADRCLMQPAIFFAFFSSRTRQHILLRSLRFADGSGRGNAVLSYAGQKWPTTLTSFLSVPPSKTFKITFEITWDDSSSCKVKLRWEFLLCAARSFAFVGFRNCGSKKCSGEDRNKQDDNRVGI